MADKFVVHVAAPPASELEPATARLAELLKLNAARAESLTRRLPDVVTKPIGLREAQVAAVRFTEAGFVAEVRHAEPRPAETSSAETSSAGPRAAGPSPTEASLDDAPRPERPASPVQRPAAGGLELPRVVGAAPSPAADVASVAEPSGEGVFADLIRSTFMEMDDTPLSSGSPRSVAAVGGAPVNERPGRAAAASAGAEAAPGPEATGAGGAAAVAGGSLPRAVVTPAPHSSHGNLTARGRTLGTAPVSATSASPAADAATQAREAARRRKADARAAAEVLERSRSAPRGRRGSLSRKMLATAIVPVLLTIVGALAAVWFTARPALYEQLLASARNPAIATAASVSSTLSAGSGEGLDNLRLLETILITRQSLARQNISFILATDADGNPLSGSFSGGSRFPEATVQLQEAVRRQAQAAVLAGANAAEVASASLIATGGERIEIVAQPLLAGSDPIGAVVVGITDSAVTEQVNGIVLNVLLFSLVPLLLAILIAVLRARRLTRNVLTLTKRADEISRGDLEGPVRTRSGDELDDLAEAIERLRVSMSGALDRLRRRR